MAWSDLAIGVAGIFGYHGREVVPAADTFVAVMVDACFGVASCEH